MLKLAKPVNIKFQIMGDVLQKWRILELADYCSGL